MYLLYNISYKNFEKYEITDYLTHNYTFDKDLDIIWPDHSVINDRFSIIFSIFTTINLINIQRIVILRDSNSKIIMPEFEFKEYKEIKINHTNILTKKIIFLG